MFLFRFVKFYRFRKNGITPEWEERYERLCENTDFLYLRHKEQKSSRLTFVGFLAFCVSMWFLSFKPIFFSWQMFVVSIFSTVLLALYALSIHSYIPMEIELTEVCHKKEFTRRPSSVVRKKIRDYGVEFVHHYYVYTTDSRKQAVDMTDRILGIDQNFDLGEKVFCFTGINDSTYYLLPVLQESDSTPIENDI